MKITFKNVGQGDSIILEWEDNGYKKIGIIDCNLNRKNENPVLDYLRTTNYDHVHFIILSHPHTDHYSGLPDLLSYLLGNNIPLKFFIHTCTTVPDFLIMANASKEAAKTLQEIVKSIQKCREKFNTVDGSITVGLSDEFPIGGGYILKLLAPTSRHLDNYTGKIDFDHDYDEVDGNSHYANWLSTVFQLIHNDSYVLFTSDTPKEVLKEIGIKHEKEYFDDKVLLLGQSPHHGAKKNHTNSFWKLRKSIKYTPIVFSVGKNSYGHPSCDAVKFFTKNDFKVYSTNKVGCLEKSPSSKDVVKGELFLDMFASDVTENLDSDYSGDKIFVMGNSTIQAIQ